MRLYLKLTESKQIIPFNYQTFLTGAIHKWIGKANPEHDALSLYSFSWLQNVQIIKNGINIRNDSYFFISAYEDNLIKKIIGGIMDSPDVCFGSTVSDIQIIDTPEFQSAQRFFTSSPVFIKRWIDDNEKHITYEDPNCEMYLTETLKRKLKAANISTEGVSVKFDQTYVTPKTKLIYYNGIGNKTSICPVLIEGSTEQLQFAWNVGIGNSTGIGFGALK